MTYRVFWFSNSEKDKIAQDLRLNLSKIGFKESNSNDSDYVFIIGGDGSFFHFSKKCAFQNTKLVGVPSGKVAFSLDFDLNDLKSMENKSWKNLELLKISFEENIYYAMNDIYISGDLFLESEVYVDGAFLEKFKGLGILFSTQYGSTGMNKSMLGTLLMPQNDLWLFKEVGSFNAKGNILLNSPLVMSKKNRVKIKVSEKSSCRIYIDGIEIKDFSKSFCISLIQGNAKILEMNSKEYVTKIKNTFLC